MVKAIGFPVEALNEENSRGWKQFASASSCSRCGGLMVIEQGFDLVGGDGHLDSRARRCVQCGEFIDSVILQNRHRSLPVRAT